MDTDSVRNLRIGVLILIIAFLIGAVQNALIKSIRVNYPAIVIVFIQYAFCLLILLPSLFKHGFATMKSKHVGLLMLRSMMGIGYFLGMFYALKTVPLVDVTLLANTGPLWVPLICLLWEGVPISWRLYGGIIVGLIGVALVLMPNDRVFSVESLFALGSGLCLGFAMVAARRLSQTESAQRILIYYFLTATLATLPFAIMEWKAPTLFQWVILITNAILMLIQQQLIYLGCSRGPASQLSITTYSSVIFSVILGWIFWKENITLLTIAGILLVIFGSYQVVTTKPSEQRMLLRKKII